MSKTIGYLSMRQNVNFGSCWIKIFISNNEKRPAAGDVNPLLVESSSGTGSTQTLAKTGKEVEEGKEASGMALEVTTLPVITAVDAADEEDK